MTDEQPQTMKVGQLRDLIAAFNDDADVLIAVWDAQGEQWVRKPAIKARTSSHLLADDTLVLASDEAALE